MHLSKGEVEALSRPVPGATKTVIDWLQQSGVQSDDVEIHGEWIHFSATVQNADEMMNAKFLTYQNLIDGEITITRTREVSLPQNILQLVNLIHPTTHFTSIKSQQPEIKSYVVNDGNEVDASCKTIITPKCLRDLYNIKGITPDPKTSGFIAVAGFLGEYPAQADLAQFAKEFAPWGLDANFTSSLHLG
jgi:tripeptidyl-peptidase-1